MYSRQELFESGLQLTLCRLCGEVLDAILNEENKAEKIACGTHPHVSTPVVAGDPMETIRLARANSLIVYIPPN